MLKNPRPGIEPQEPGKTGPIEFIESLQKKGHTVAYIGDVVCTGLSRKPAPHSVLWLPGEDIPDVPSNRFLGVVLGHQLPPPFPITLQYSGPRPTPPELPQLVIA